MTDTTAQLRAMLYGEEKKNTNLAARVGQKKLRLKRVRNLVNDIHEFLKHPLLKSFSFKK